MWKFRASIAPTFAQVKREQLAKQGKTLSKKAADAIMAPSSE